MTAVLPVYREQIYNFGNQTELLFSQVTTINYFIIFVEFHCTYFMAHKTEGPISLFTFSVYQVC